MGIHRYTLVYISTYRYTQAYTGIHRDTQVHTRIHCKKMGVLLHTSRCVTAIVLWLTHSDQSGCWSINQVYTAVRVGLTVAMVGVI